MESPRRPIVTIVYRQLPRYRIPFYEELRRYLDAHGRELRLIYGQPSPDEAAKNDTGDLPWGRRIRNRVVPIGPRGLYWQPCLRQLRDSDLVIVEQASRLLLNYVLLAAQRLGGPKVGLWGHGRNFQVHDASRLGEWLKRRISRLPHWWFAYNEASAGVVRGLGFPPERITVVQNAVDTQSLRQAMQSIGEQELARVRGELGICGTHVGVFVGGLYPEKRIPFLIEAARHVRDRVPEFELLVVGDGRDAGIVREAAQVLPWLRYVGPKFGADKVPYCLLAKAMLMPGLVGLAVVDAFALELPLVTVDLPFHSPEIEYLRHGVNGIRVQSGATPEQYAEVVASLLLDHRLQERLRAGCREASRIYTLGGMVERFGEGVLRALAD